MALPVLNKLLVVVINLMGVFLAVTVYRRDPGRAVNRTFLLTIFLMLIWVNFGYLPRVIARIQPELALELMRFAWLSTPMFCTSLYFLTVYLTHSHSRFQRLHWLAGIMGLAATTLAGLDGVVVTSLRFVGDSVGINYGPGMWPFLGAISVIMGATGYIFYWNYLSLPVHSRLQLQHVGLGLAIFYLANTIFNIALPVILDVVRWYWIGDYSTLAVLGLTSYAIVRRNLFGIRIVVTALMVALITILLAADVIVFTQAEFPRAAKLVVLLLFLYLGWMLVQSVHREIDQREKLQKIAAELRRSDEAKTEFISIVSHQLRTPLNAIEGYLTLLLEGAYGRLDAQKRRPVERLYRSNERLIHLVNDLLGVSRIQMGRIELEMADVDLCTLARSVVEEFGMAAEEKGIELHAKCPARGVPSFTGDVQKLRDSILNLVDNAIRYTNEGRVEVSVNREGDDVVVGVTDSGPGIDEAEMRALFASFRRGDVGRRQWTEGSGLGLYIAQQFVALHGGVIWAESAGKGRGSTFFIRLPLHRGEMAA